MHRSGRAAAESGAAPAASGEMMLFLVIAGVVASLELWAVSSGGHGESALPLVLRIGGPILLALSAVRFQGQERIGVLLTATSLFLLVNTRLLGTPAIASTLIGVTCVALAVTGVSMRAGELKVRLLLVASVASAVAYFGLIWFLTRT